MLNLDTQTIGNRYQLMDKLGEGGMGAVYRAADRLTGQNVALKRVTFACPQDDDHILDFRYALAQEFKVLASLRHPHIISVLDYGFAHDREPYFTLELLENTQSIIDYAQNQPLAKQVELLIQMLQALAYLHQREIIHRDLKPENVMIVHDQVKVLDFGLAIAREHLNPESELVGTLFYMAPETFSGTPVSVASDLYAVGIIMYELFTGSVPFESSNNKYALMYKIARTPPDHAPLADSPLRDVILRLLQKKPSDRYASANEVIAALCETTGYPHPPESSAVRESFLQAARFVGREVEFDVLREALNQARAGQGSAWLVGGESGVGKSRLLDELRTHALVEGALVLRGQAIAEGGLPYQIWRSAVRRLVLQTDLTDLTASVLKPLVPDMDRLLGHEVPELPQVDAQSLQVRLLSVIESLFRQPQLIVLLLEDLHWADESLVLLKRLNELAADSPLLIIGTYRDEERPGLPKELPALHHLKLERLTPASIEMLSESMLGEVGKSPMVVDLLTHETEGNVFFIVEVVRALAEEAGQLADVGRLTLPEHVFAGGMHTVIQRRLDKLPKSARYLMTFAAVAGRELDLQMLHTLMPTLDLDDWLQDVATVVEVRGAHYRFAHDKLREGILNSLQAEERRQLHKEVALAIETTYPDSTEQYTVLAYHWGQAHDAAKTIHNATLAGQQSSSAGSYREAIQFFTQALALTDQVSLSDRQLGNLYHRVGNAYWGLSDFSLSRAAHIKALSLLGFTVPDEPKQLVLHSLKPLFSHIGRRVFQRRPHPSHPEDLLTAAQSLHEITQGSYHDANFVLGLHCILNGMDIAERAGSSPQAIRLQVLHYCFLGFATGDIGIHKIARFYLRMAEKGLQRESTLETLAWFDFVKGAYLAGQGEWEQCNQLLAEALRISRMIGNLGLWVEASEFRTNSLLVQSRFSDALALNDDTLQLAIRDGHIQSVGAMHSAKARLLLLQGKTDESKQYYRENEAVITASFNDDNQALVGKILSQALLIDFSIRDETWDDALKSVKTLETLITTAQTLSFMFSNEASAPIRLYLTLWEKQANATYRQSAEAAFKLFHRKYTSHFPIGYPVELAYRCWYHWLNGSENEARKIGVLAIQQAQSRKMPFYEALAHYHLGRFMTKSDPERAPHLETAIRLFDQLGAAYNAERARQDK